MAGIGHNSGVSLDAVVEENLRRGLLLTQRDVLMRMSRDPRVKMKHMRIIVEIIERTNSQTGLAYPGRKRIAEDTRFIIPDVLESPDPYSESSVAKVISDLIKWGYLVSERKAPREGGRAIAHYSIAIPTVEQLQQEITAYVESIRKRGKIGPPPIQTRLPFGDDVPNGRNVKSVDVPDGRNIRPPNVPPCRNDSDVPAGRNIRSDVPTGVRSDVPTGDPPVVPTGGPTGTSIRTRDENQSSSSDMPRARWPDDDNGRDYLVRFIAKWTNCDEQSARAMLATNIQIYGVDVMEDAYARTRAAMQAGHVAKPYPYLIRAAGNIRDERKRAKQQRRTSISEIEF